MQDGNRLAEVSLDSAERRLHVGVVADVTPVWTRLAARAGDVLGGRRCRRSVDVEAPNPRSLGGEPARHRSPDPRPRAGYHTEVVGEAHE